MQAAFLSLLVAALLPYAIDTAHALAEPARHEPLVDSRVRTLLYVPNQVLRLRGKIGLPIDVEFEVGENVVEVGGGDLAGLRYAASGNHLVLKPVAAVLRTALMVSTNRRTYSIDYSVSAGSSDPKAKPLIAVRFIYPNPRPRSDRAHAYD